MEVTKTVRCKLIGLTRRKSCSGDNLQHWKQERIKYSAYKMRGGYKKAKKMRSNEDLIDREETLTFTVKKDVELKKEYPSIIEERRIVNDETR